MKKVIIDKGLVAGVLIGDVAGVSAPDDVQIGWAYDGVKFTAPAAASLDEIRARKWEAIKAQRDRRKASGVAVSDQWFHSDADSRIQWLGIKDTARDLLAAGKAGTEPVPVLGQPLQWKTLGGEFVAVTVQMALDVVTATKELDARLFAIAEQKRLEVEASADPASYDTAAGWPATFEG